MVRNLIGALCLVFATSAYAAEELPPQYDVVRELLHTTGDPDGDVTVSSRTCQLPAAPAALGTISVARTLRVDTYTLPRGRDDHPNVHTHTVTETSLDGTSFWVDVERRNRLGIKDWRYERYLRHAEGPWTRFDLILHTSADEIRAMRAYAATMFQSLGLGSASELAEMMESCGPMH